MANGNCADGVIQTRCSAQRAASWPEAGITANTPLTESGCCATMGCLCGRLIGALLNTCGCEDHVRGIVGEGRTVECAV